MRPRAVSIGLVLSLACSCTLEERVFDPFPVSMETRSGAVFIGVSGSDGQVRSATLDTLSPITILDSSGGTAEGPVRVGTNLTVYSASGTPRLTFANTEVFDIHPCNNGGPIAPCSVGLDADASEIEGIVGTNLLSLQSVRIDFAANELRFFPDTAGTDNDRSELCEALFNNPFAGGGTLVVPDGEVDYSGNRPALGACLDGENPIDPATPAEDRGADALLVISTGIGPSILSQSAYDRYAREIGGPLTETLPDAVLHLPSGPVGAKRGSLGHVTLLGEVGSDSQERGPCRELYANRVLSEDLCNAGVVTECPCPDNDKFCRAAGALLISGPIDVAILPDEHSMLQALRVELRPEFPEVDGVLGASALVATRIDFDYPNLRMVGRCSDAARCSARPQVSRLADLGDVTSCLSP